MTTVVSQTGEEGQPKGVSLTDRLPVDCTANPCLNGGVCSVTMTRRPVGQNYQCMCAAGFMGINCESSMMSPGIMPPPPHHHPVDPLPDFCASGPCMNGGACSTMPRGYQCMCAGGFIGENCESMMDDGFGRPMHPVDPLPPTPAPAGTHGGAAGNAVPSDCTSWNDGCNTCGVSNGRVTMCTDMACFRQGTPFCTLFADGTACRDSDCSAAHAAGAKATDAPTGACSTDADCGTGFCRPTSFDYSGPKECTAFSPAGISCGGMMPPQFQTRCAPGLECVNTMAMMMDAPGTCGPACPTTSMGRDQWGSCIDAGCQTWFDGCNTCTDGSCTEMWCDTRGTAECRDSATAPAGGNDQCAACQARQARGENIVSPQAITATSYLQESSLTDCLLCVQACFNLCNTGAAQAGQPCADGFCEDASNCPQCKY